MPPSILSQQDIQRIDELNSSIKSIPQNIIIQSKNQLLEALNSNHAMNRIIRGDNGQIDAYLACSDVDQNSPYFRHYPDQKVVHIQYVFSQSDKITNIQQEFTKFIKRAKKLGYDIILFNGMNKRLAKVLEYM